MSKAVVDYKGVQLSPDIWPSKILCAEDVILTGNLAGITAFTVLIKGVFYLLP